MVHLYINPQCNVKHIYLLWKKKLLNNYEKEPNTICMLHNFLKVWLFYMLQLESGNDKDVNTIM